MYYVKSVEVPAQTYPDNPVRSLWKVSFGYISRFEIGYPPGCCGLAHARVLYHSDQIYPTALGSTFAWDDWNYVIRDWYPLFVPPFNLVVEVFNLDDSYKHLIEFRCEILHPSTVMMAGGYSGFGPMST